MISNCGHDERGKYSGGKAGDQTGTEWQVINWYNRPWKCVLRHPKDTGKQHENEPDDINADNNEEVQG